MESIVIYIAVDGNHFFDENECYVYETKILHKNFFDIKFFDENNNELKIELKDELYSKCEKMIVHNEKELADLQCIATEFGWVEFELINSVGTWKRNDTDDFECTWEKLDNDNS